MKVIGAGIFFLTLGLCSLSASAAVMDAKTIRITQNLNDGSWLMIADIQAFVTSGGTNWASQANGGVASADSSGFGSVPGDANDGNTNPNFGGGSVWHSGAPGPTGWVQVDLLNPRDISFVDIYLRSDTSPHWSSNFQLQIWDASNTLQYDEAITGYGASPYLASIEVDGAASPVPIPASWLLMLLGIGAISHFRKGFQTSTHWRRS